jgi:hypothetical protein
MNFFELGRGLHVLVALENIYIVLKPEFFEQPNDALGTRVVEPGWGVSVTIG